MGEHGKGKVGKKEKKDKKKKKDKKRKDETAKLLPGSQAWVQGEKEEWKLVEVVERLGSSILRIQPIDGREKSSKVDLEDKEFVILPANRLIVPDMTNLQHFHIPGILHNLKERSFIDEPYTFLSGAVLVAINPLRRVPDPEGILGSPAAVSTPHPYAIAESAYQQLLFSIKRRDVIDTPVDQSIIVGGESGAGKTESFKYVLKHLVNRSMNEGSGKDDSDLDRRLIESNPILEAFGNAATKRNHNSSRFGKFMKLHYTKPGKKNKPVQIFGASVKTYLLERSRVTFHVEGERTYHIFYQLVHGATKKMKKKLGLEDGLSFSFLLPKKHSSSSGGKSKDDRYLAKISSHLPAEEDDKRAFKKLNKALATIGLASDSEGDDPVFAIVAAILHLGNVEFTNKDSSEGNVAVVKNEDVFNTAAKLLGVKASKLERVFSEHAVVTMRETLIKKRDARGAKFALDAVVKYLYSGLFDWVVNRITMSLSEKGSLEGHSFIGVLDIFGFETFLVNDFEQLLINFTNEALQSCFNQQIFQAEVQLYEKEGLLLEEGARQLPPDNEECMALLEGGPMAGDSPGAKLGILGVIDAEGKNPQPNDDKLNTALHRTFKSHPNFPTPHPKDIRSCFIVKHYAGPVKYTVGAFIEKNSDMLPTEAHEVLKESSVEIVADVFSKGSDPVEDGASKKKKKSLNSVSSKFKLEITKLIDDLNSTRCAFIRCIKPNATMTREGKKDKSWFDSSYVMPQLINLSIPQTAEVLRGGLPTRIEFSMFIEAYKEKLPKAALRTWKSIGKGDEQLFVKALFFAFGIPPDNYKVGRTRVFFKAGMLDKVNDLLKEALSGKSLDDEIVLLFSQSFTRALWRKIFVKMLTVKVFLNLLKETKEKQGAASILQRLARRRMQMMREREEMDRRREEEERRELEEEEQRVKAEKKRKKQLKKERELAKSEEERLKLEAKEARLDASIKMRDDKVKRLSVARVRRKGDENDRRRSVRAVSMRLTGGKSTVSMEDLRKSFRKSLAVDKRKLRALQEEDDEEEDEEEEEELGFCTDAVQYRNVSPQILQRSASGKSSLSSILCFSSAFKKSDRRQSEPQLLDERDHFDNCFLQINGFQLRLFTDCDKDINGALIGKGQPVRVVQINEAIEVGDQGKLAASKDIKKGQSGVQPTFLGNIDPCVVSLCYTRNGSEFIRFKFEEAFDAETFKSSIQRQKLRFVFELEEAERFQQGDFSTEAILEYKMMLDKGLISKEDFEVALMQQVSNDTEYLDDLIGNYGEDAYADFKVRCPNCQVYLFNLPTDPLEKCPECGCDDIDSPQVLEDEARVARMKIEQERIQGFAKKGQQDGFPLFLMHLSEKFHFKLPKTTISLSDDQTRDVYKYEMEWSRQVNGEEWEDFIMIGTWEYLKDFFENEIGECPGISEETLSKIPGFPDDDDSLTSDEAQAQHRLACLIQYLVVFLPLYLSEELYQYKPIRTVLGCSV